MADPLDSLEQLMGAARPHAQVDANFELRLREMRQHAAEEAARMAATGQTRWYRPEDWNGDPNDVDGMSEPFRRTQANDDFVSLVSSRIPGPHGDAIACAAMADQLGVLERALRIRYAGEIRPVALATGRLEGHGHERGVFTHNHLEFVRALLQDGRR